MNAVMLDTNVLIDLFHDPDSFLEELGDYEEVLLPSIVLGEFRAGLSSTKKDREIEDVLSAYLKNPAVKTAPVTERTTLYYANVFRELKAKGRPIPQNDVWIAATALECGVPLLTYDSHFSAVPMLRLIDRQSQMI